jgi:hypothetical protein
VTAGLSEADIDEMRDAWAEWANLNETVLMQLYGRSSSENSGRSNVICLLLSSGLVVHSISYHGKSKGERLTTRESERLVYPTDLSASER